MKCPKLLCLTVAVLFTTTWSAPAQRQEFFLGDAPQAPADVSQLPRAPRLLSITGGFTVNPASREEVRSFYNAVYKSSDGIPMESTADVLNCVPGTNAAEFDRATLRRINWFRAMAGVPAIVSFAETNNFKARQAAVMMSRNTNLSHFPPTTWLCYSVDGTNAAQNSNLALGSTGADAITGYIWDFGANNTVVGHRRWLLYPQTQVMGTGDVPGQNGLYEANATWVFDANLRGPRPATRSNYVAWPPPGFAPYPVVFPRWSFSLTNANFTNATVTMRSNGVAIAVAKETVASGVGENSIVWVPMGLNANSFSTTFPFSGADTVYSVAISNILNAPQSWYTYTVTVFDPAVPGADYFPPTLSGTSQPTVGAANAYAFTAVTNATSYQWRATLRTPYNLTDGAESGLGNFMVNTSAGYNVRDSSLKASGSYSFHLAHPSPPTDQLLTLTQGFTPNTNSVLTFKSLLGTAGTAQTATVQVSTNGGLDWVDLYSQVGSGSPGELTFTTRSIPLAGLAGVPAQLRFNYAIGGGSYYPQTSTGVGWYLDDIVLTNAEVWAIQGTNTTATTNFTFTPSQPGTFNLEARALIFTEFPLDWGPTKTVTAVAAPPSISLSRPILTNNQMWISFTVQSLTNATFKLLQADQPQGPWTTNTAATLVTNTPNVAYRYTLTPSGNAKFYRVRTP